MNANARGALYETITNDIIRKLKKGVAPRAKPWDAPGRGMLLLPYNAMIHRRYRGVNVLIPWRAVSLRPSFLTPDKTPRPQACMRLSAFARVDEIERSGHRTLAVPGAATRTRHAAFPKDAARSAPPGRERVRGPPHVLNRRPSEQKSRIIPGAPDR